MVGANIPSPLQYRVTHFYNYIWTRTNGIQSKVLFKDTAHCMKASIFSRYVVYSYTVYLLPAMVEGHGPFDQ